MEEAKRVFNEFAIASLALGFLSYVHLFGAEKAVAAITLGALSLRASKRDAGIKGRGMAVAGIILGAASIILTGHS